MRSWDSDSWQGLCTGAKGSLRRLTGELAGGDPFDRGRQHQSDIRTQTQGLRQTNCEAKPCERQEWVKDNGERIIVVFEGRGGAGKSCTIKTTEGRVSPRVVRVAALDAPSGREKSQQRPRGR